MNRAAKILASVIALSSLTAALLSAPVTARAITLDSFDTAPDLASTTTAGSTVSRADASSVAIGGDRQITVANISGDNSQTRIRTMPDVLQFSLDENEGSAIIDWDGDGDPSKLTPNGLGSVDLTQDGGTSLILRLRRFDLAFGEPINLGVTLYSAQNPNAQRFSEVTIKINQAWNSASPFLIKVPLALFTTQGSSSVAAPSVGGAPQVFETFTRFGTLGSALPTGVGAIRLTIQGDSSDLSLGPITTDGRCTSIPDATGSVLGSCGVCREITDGENRDKCGVCLKGPPGWDYSKQRNEDSCGLCPSDVGYLFPDGLRDPCGICGGNGDSCRDCNGVPNGGAGLDICGVCGGNGTSCLDCKGVPNGTSKKDACGVCNGDNSSCADCQGVPNGGQVRDICGVCGGKATDAASCQVAGVQCAIVPAPKEIQQYEKTLVQKARTLRQRYTDEKRRGKKANCSFPTNVRDRIMNNAFTSISTRSKQIFTSGVEVCGTSCVTTSYATQVEALLPNFKSMQQQSVAIARDVKKCYAQKGIGRAGPGSRGVADTVSTVNSGLTKLIEACRSTKVCPPGA
jgi:hypothetical protein